MAHSSWTWTVTSSRRLSLVPYVDLSHRWQVPSIVRIFENILEDTLSSSNFEEIAEAAALKSS